MIQLTRQVMKGVNEAEKAIGNATEEADALSEQLLRVKKRGHYMEQRAALLRRAAEVTAQIDELDAAFKEEQ